MEQLLRNRQAAEVLGISTRTIDKWRSCGGGPPYLQIGGAIRYSARDLEAWIEQRRRRSTFEKAA